MNYSRLVTILIFALAASVTGAIAAPAPADAWQAVVLPSETETVDVALTDDASRALFTSVIAGSSLTVTLTGSASSAALVDLYILARAPENDRRAGSLPQLLQARDSDLVPTILDPHEMEEDPATGLRFERISTMQVPRGAAQFQVTSPRASSRALIVVRTPDGPVEFELDQPTSVPRTVATMRQWYDAGNGRASQGTVERSKIMVWSVVLGVAIVVSMVALAIWWGTRGRRSSRRPKHDA